MTDQDRELFEKALDMLMDAQLHNYALKHKETDDLITAMRERLAQPEQEPVAFVDPIWMQRPDLIIEQRLEIKKLFARVQVMDYVPLYTAPQPAPTIDKSAAIRIATALGWVPAGDTSQERKRWHKAGARAIRMAINIEREACAQIADVAEPYQAADLIRARGNT